MIDLKKHVTRALGRFKQFIVVDALALFILLFSPVLVSAESPGLTFENPLTSIQSIPEFIDALLTIIMKIAIPIIVIFIIIAGFQFVTARGDTEKLKRARAAFLAVVIGAAIILAAKVLVSAITGTIHQLGV